MCLGLESLYQRERYRCLRVRHSRAHCFRHVDRRPCMRGMRMNISQEITTDDWDELVVKASRRLLKRLRFITFGSHVVAEDLAQEAVLRLLQAPEKRFR